jgi:phosphate transport system protein
MEKSAGKGACHGYGTALPQLCNTSGPICFIAMASHYEESLERDIGRIRRTLTEMAKLATDALEACAGALVARNRQTAYTVILRDRRIDELEKELDRLCLEFLIRQQPVARHLRFAYTTIKVNLELERIGDYAESIARQVLKLSNIEVTPPLERFQQLATLSIPMVRDAVKAFVTGDDNLARHVISREEETDALRSAINADLFQLRQEGKLPQEALNPLMTIARRFERSADQAANIAEEVIYMVTGEYQKHVGGQTWRMVFIDEHNHCRSQMAEAIGASLNQPHFIFASAGLEPQPIDPGTTEFLKSKGLDISRSKSRSVDQLPSIDAAQIIVALSPNAKRAFPKPTKAVCLDWSIPDPSLVKGDAETKRTAYEQAYQFLSQQISDLCEAVLGDKID